MSTIISFLSPANKACESFFYRLVEEEGEEGGSIVPRSRKMVREAHMLFSRRRERGSGWSFSFCSLVGLLSVSSVCVWGGGCLCGCFCLFRASARIPLVVLWLGFCGWSSLFCRAFLGSLGVGVWWWCVSLGETRPARAKTKQRGHAQRVVRSNAAKKESGRGRLLSIEKESIVVDVEKKTGSRVVSLTEEGKGPRWS